MLNPADIEALAAGRHANPFAVLGMHEHDGHLWVRAMLPGARAVKVVDALTGRAVATLTGVDAAGIFEGPVPRRRKRFAYRLKINWMGAAQSSGEDAATELEDPYRFPAVLGDMDVWLLAEGKHTRVYEKLGAHRVTLLGVEGVSFALWAPNARRVSVVGDFNFWDGRRHPMRLRRECGVWEIFIPGLTAGVLYKYQLLNAAGKQLPLKADPFAFASELRPATGSIVTGTIVTASSSNGQRLPRGRADPGHRLPDTSAARDRAVSIYEVHAGSWRRGEGGRLLTWGEIGDQLLPYVRKLGFTHLEFLPVMEHPFDGSWGYQPTGLYAPTARHGTPGEFAALVRRCHNEGLGVLLDWVPGHFPGDAHALAQFDGTHLYEHADPRQGVHPDWNTLIYNFGRREVCNFLSANALFWLERFAVDGLRVDAVASMLYLDYSRPPGQWLPNARGGRENLDAVAFIRETNRLVAAEHPGAVVIAEESTAWAGVTRTVQDGGLGFNYKWNMGWMNDTLGYMRRDPVHRRHHHNALTFGLMYAFDEAFVLPLSHDEVVHGKRSLVGKMPGDRWQRFANLRLYFGFMWAHPGKKLLFMGGEFGQEAEWNHDAQLDWNALNDPLHQGLQRLVADLNRVYRDLPALHHYDCEPRGFEWLDSGDPEQSVLAFLRRGRNDNQCVVAVCNFTPVPRLDYRVGVPRAGRYRELINTDSAWYGGSDLGNHGGVETLAAPCHGRDYSLQLCLPPLACLMFVWGAQ